MSRHDALYARALDVLPGGVSSPVRAFKSVGGEPRYMCRGEGAFLVGEEGERWVDFCMAWGPLILGHAHPEVVDAVTRAARDGLAFGTVHRGEVELGERILAAFPGRDRVRLVVTGTEAVLTALRLARGVTGRSKILKFSGCYHGHVDALLVKGAGSGLVTFGTGESAGVTDGSARDTLVVPLDDEAAVDAAFATHGADIAAVFVEPMPANNGLLVQRHAWLSHLRQRCDEHGALLVFDEVISGFRLGFHGYERVCGVTPDLTTLGKIVGGGLPVAAVVGRAAVLDQLAPLGPVYQAGTMAGNPVCVAAGIATLDVLGRDTAVYDHLDALGRAFDAAAGRARWVRRGPVVWPSFAAEAPRTDSAIPSDSGARFRPIFRHLLDSGVYFPPSAYEVGFFSAAHTIEQVTRLATLVDAAW